MQTLTALEIKTALMYYFRFQRQWLCAPEVDFDGGRADILIDTGEDIREVEIKISKSDLYNGESKKDKHRQGVKCNKFYICVPDCLMDDAEKWVLQTEPNYGIILYQPHYNSLVIRRSAKSLNRQYYPEIRKKIEMRLSTMVYDFMNKQCKNIKCMPLNNGQSI